jgi:hypothetical protein
MAYDADALYAHSQRDRAIHRGLGEQAQLFRLRACRHPCCPSLT